MKKLLLGASLGASLVVVVLAALAVSSFAQGEGGKTLVRADDGLIGFSEVPAISTNGTGTFEAEIDDENDVITYTLTYQGLTAPAAAAHIHLGQRSVNGGVAAFLCGGDTKPPCPPGTADQAVVTGTITQADIAGPANQGITPRVDFEEVVAALRAGRVYANVHNSVFPGGEIRGQVNDADQRDG